MGRYLKQLISRSPRLFYFLKKVKLCLCYIFKLSTDQDYYYFKNYSSGVLLDIGANCGQTVVSIHNINPNIRIISFEPNRGLDNYLQLVKRWFGEKYNYYLFGIGTDDSVQDFYIPKINNSFLYGEGTFVKEELLENATIERIKTKFTIEEFKFETKNFDKLNEILKLKPDFVKIDTQGYELNVLRGMVKTLNDFRPVLLIENNAGFQEINTLLHHLNYEICSYHPKRNKLEEYTKGRTNFFAIPK